MERRTADTKQKEVPTVSQLPEAVNELHNEPNLYL